MSYSELMSELKFLLEFTKTLGIEVVVIEITDIHGNKVLIQ